MPATAAADGAWDVAALVECLELPAPPAALIADYVRVYSDLVLLLDHLLAAGGGTREPVSAAVLERALRRAQDRLGYWRARLGQRCRLELDPGGRLLRYGDRTARLTARELELIACLLRHRDRPLPARHLAALAWSSAHLGPDQVRGYVSRLRTKLRLLGAPCGLVAADRRGYRLLCGCDRCRRAATATTIEDEPVSRCP